MELYNWSYDVLEQQKFDSSDREGQKLQKSRPGTYYRWDLSLSQWNKAEITSISTFKSKVSKLRL